MKVRGKKSGLIIELNKNLPILFNGDEKFIPYCVMRDKPCYDSYKFKCPNYDEYIVK